MISRSTCPYLKEILGLVRNYQLVWLILAVFKDICQLKKVYYTHNSKSRYLQTTAVYSQIHLHSCVHKREFKRIEDDLTRTRRL